jgi:RNA polymerase sporulation-specific sigma factor
MNEIQEKQTTYDKNPELIRRYREGDEEAGERLVEINLPLVYSIAGRFRERCDDMSDLIECGTLGLCKAIKTFDVGRGCAFSTYAVPLIFGEIRRFLRDDGIIKVSREEKRLCALLIAERERRLAVGEDARIAAIAAAVGVSAEDAASAISSGAPIRSLDERAFDDDDSQTISSIVCDEDAEGREFDRLALKCAIERLPTEQKKLIILRYYRDLSQTETARVLGISQVKVSREEKKIMQALKQALA